MGRLGAAMILAVGAALVAAAVASGHHGWSSYDDSREVALTGRIRSSSYEHPHVTVQLETEQRIWTVILPPPTRARAMGLTAELLGEGSVVRVAGYVHRSVPDEMRALRIAIGERVFRLR
ncbi:MAG: DUF6152 family protein [Armatimonadota bacterium]|nr:DUF6152 family protein [Armatimonadota bacterium]MDR5696303.1 DUF6152 family protein [Armatimonadota bacterium]